MDNRRLLDNQHKQYIAMNYIKSLANKESVIGLYFLCFILGIKASSGYGIYNESRIAELVLLLGLNTHACFYNRYLVKKTEWLFFASIIVLSYFWSHAIFVVVDLLLFYLLYKSFYFITYRPLVSKLIVFASFLIFLLLPIALWDFIQSGVYSSDWYLLRLNIRIYNSYFLILSIFVVWFYLTEKRYQNFYLCFLFLAFLSMLLDGGRSSTLAYTAFIAIICLFNRRARWQLLAVYAMSWFSYLTLTYFAHLNTTSSAVNLQIVRATTSQRYDIWMNALHCWSQNPVLGCGFYQLDSDRTLAAHPHNIFMQSLTETGLIGFGFLMIIVVIILKHIDWSLTRGYFVIGSLLAVSIELSLSGAHIYPITQIALLWLCVFLLKNPSFTHAQYFIREANVISSANRYFSIALVLSITIFFVYVFFSTTALIDTELMTRPRFFENGYRLLD